ncbi:MAG: cytochrome c biogenesis protein CcdA [Spirochaetaceae bacterium]|jgi:cytochrome c-type biogenesis protein|nr:cytochrome c biogenesis protein CcdA [Spirochaetaceae bacterium]
MDAKLSVASAFVAGLLSFASPCVLPLLSSYLAFIGGGATAPPDGGKLFSRHRLNLVASTAFFVLGFSVVFIALSLIVYGFMFFLGGMTRALNIIAGAIVMLLGANTLFNFIPFLKHGGGGGEYCETCVPEHSILAAKKGSPLHRARRPRGATGAFLVGVAFGIGWTPCVGVILGSILMMAGQSGKMALSALYLAVYSAGLGVPFLFASFFWGALIESGSRLKHFPSIVKTISGIFLIAMGLAMVFGRYSMLTSFVQACIDCIAGV